MYQTVNSFTGRYQTVNSFTGRYQTVNSFMGGLAREFVHARRGGLVAREAHRMNSVSDTSNPLKRVALVGTGLVGL